MTTNNDTEKQLNELLSLSIQETLNADNNNLSSDDTLDLIILLAETELNQAS